MKNFFQAIFLILLSIISFVGKTEAEEKLIVYFFHGEGCLECAKIEPYITDLTKKYPQVEFKTKEVYFDETNRQVFFSMAQKIDNKSTAVPSVFIHNKQLVGDTEIRRSLENELKYYIEKNCTCDPANLEKTCICDEENQTSFPNQENFSSITLWAVISGALVDAINPCAFAVLILLVASLMAAQKRKEALFAGLLFSLAIFISYLLMGMGLLKILQTQFISGFYIMKITGILAIILGLAQIKDYFWYGKIFLTEIPLSWRPKMKELIKNVTSPIGSFFVGFLVSLFLLPCSSGPYIVILTLLSEKETFTRAFFYLLFYNAIFIIPMIAITFIVYFGTDPLYLEKMRKKNVRTLHLIAGIILITLGVAMLSGII